MSPPSAETIEEQLDDVIGQVMADGYAALVLGGGLLLEVDYR